MRIEYLWYARRRPPGVMNMARSHKVGVWMDCVVLPKACGRLCCVCPVSHCVFPCMSFCVFPCGAVGEVLVLAHEVRIYCGIAKELMNIIISITLLFLTSRNPGIVN